MLCKALLGDEKELYADRGYAPSRKMMEEKYPQIVDKIMYKRQQVGCGKSVIYRNTIIKKMR